MYHAIARVFGEKRTTTTTYRWNPSEVEERVEGKGTMSASERAQFPEASSFLVYNEKQPAFVVARCYCPRKEWADPPPWKAARSES